MKNTFFSAAIAAIAFSAAPVLAGGPAAVTTYTVDATKSAIVWVGKKVTGEHTGTINYAGGKIMADGAILKGGEFEVDMNSINCTDLKDAETNKNFIGHMKSDDFFGVEKFPKAMFKMTSVKKTGANTYDITGDLNLKGKTESITFPATVTMKGKEMMAKGKIKINRTKHDIKYGSGSFFEGLGDKMISDDFDLDFNMVAYK
jgi:polyisoprenoid-binding protein YceI